MQWRAEQRAAHGARIRAGGLLGPSHHCALRNRAKLGSSHTEPRDHTVAGGGGHDGGCGLGLRRRDILRGGDLANGRLQRPHLRLRLWRLRCVLYGLQAPTELKSHRNFSVSLDYTIW